MIENFKYLEVKRLKQLRLAALIFLIVIDIAILAFFCYAFYTSYAERNIHTPGFFIYMLPSILYIQAVLLLFFLPLIFIVYRRTGLFLKLIHQLDDQHLLLYQSYISSIARLFPGIPPYIFTESELAIPSNLSIKRIPYSYIKAITVQTTNGSNPFRYKMVIEAAHKNLQKFVFSQEIQSKFAASNLKEKNPLIIVQTIA